MKSAISQPRRKIALLRILQEREFERVGGNQPIRADVRVIAATPLRSKSRHRGQELSERPVYRLNVFPIHVPPLRERPSDIPLLIEHFPCASRAASWRGKSARR